MTTWNTINTSGAPSAWGVIVTSDLELRVISGGGFSMDAISSGPFSALGVGFDPTPAASIWNQVNTYETPNWNVVVTQP
jgi:hypothetical protein